MTGQPEPEVRTARCGDVDIAYDTLGSPQDPTVLLVNGLGTQLTGWHPDLCAAVAAEGFHVVRFDNRDVGLSTHLHEAGRPDLSPLAQGGTVTDAPYTLADMAADTAGLVDALGVERVHLVGVSLGGMVAQETALAHPERVASLTSVMSTPGGGVGRGTPEALAVLTLPPVPDEAAAGERGVAVARVIGSPAYPADEAEVAQRSRAAYRRANDPVGVARQYAAVLASGDRTERLRGLAVPTLVVHGEADPLIRVEAGRATADAVPGARLVTLPGMGHDLPRELWPRLVAEIAAHARAAQERTG
ncbi:alpha/beta fold hydrolase [Phycicoccus flavus]|uniref:alpha/beta fold hydrolase n=1 Tax=Phycicoccus flavus TaxID=2502783 RepID=UPI000FEB7405|nr:alpha/beta fold hydrolase [Phycicoccus flavus]NHA66438.1 alpha/beta fold hydrolase [Phycicoccus flavus]